MSNETSSVTRNRGGRPSNKDRRAALVAQIQNGSIEVELMEETLRLVRSKGTSASVKLQCLQLLTQIDPKPGDRGEGSELLIECEIGKVLGRLVARVRAIEAHYKKPIWQLIPILVDKGCHDPRT